MEEYSVTEIVAPFLMYPTLKPDEKLILNRLSITLKKDITLI